MWGESIIFGNYHQSPYDCRFKVEMEATYMDDLSYFSTSHHTYIQDPFRFLDGYRHAVII